VFTGAFPYQTSVGVFDELCPAVQLFLKQLSTSDVLVDRACFNSCGILYEIDHKFNKKSTIHNQDVLW